MEYSVYLNVRIKYIKLLGKKTTGENLNGLEFGKDFLSMTPKARTLKEKEINKLDFITTITKNLALQMSLLRKRKDKPQYGSKYLQYVHSTKNLCIDYIKNSYDNNNKTNNPIKNGQKI